MKETEQGMVIPFKLSGSRMRRSAQEYRRRGQPMGALLFLRRAAEQEDTPSGRWATGRQRPSCWQGCSPGTSISLACGWKWPVA